MLIGAIAGIVCDGAKETCAYKLSTAAATAIEYAYLVVKEGVSLPCSMGIVANEIEDTFKKLGKLNWIRSLQRIPKWYPALTQSETTKWSFFFSSSLTR